MSAKPVAAKRPAPVHNPSPLFPPTTAASGKKNVRNAALSPPQTRKDVASNAAKGRGDQDGSRPHAQQMQMQRPAQGSPSLNVNHNNNSTSSFLSLSRTDTFRSELATALPAGQHHLSGHPNTLPPPAPPSASSNSPSPTPAGSVRRSARPSTQSTASSHSLNAAGGGGDAAGTAPTAPPSPPPQVAAAAGTAAPPPVSRMLLSSAHPGSARGGPQSPYNVPTPSSRKGLATASPSMAPQQPTYASTVRAGSPPSSIVDETGRCRRCIHRSASPPLPDGGSHPHPPAPAPDGPRGRAGTAYRYPAPPPVADQLYLNESAVVQLSGLPNLTLNRSRTHYTPSPFVYEPGGSNPNHRAGLCFPSDQHRSETHTAAGRLQTPAGRGNAADGFASSRMLLESGNARRPPTCLACGDGAVHSSRPAAAAAAADRVEQTPPVSLLCEASSGEGRSPATQTKKNGGASPHGADPAKDEDVGRALPPPPPPPPPATANEVLHPSLRHPLGSQLIATGVTLALPCQRQTSAAPAGSGANASGIEMHTNTEAGAARSGTENSLSAVTGSSSSSSLPVTVFSSKLRSPVGTIARPPTTSNSTGDDTVNAVAVPSQQTLVEPARDAQEEGEKEVPAAALQLKSSQSDMHEKRPEGDRDKPPTTTTTTEQEEQQEQEQEQEQQEAAPSRAGEPPQPQQRLSAAAVAGSPPCSAGGVPDSPSVALYPGSSPPLGGRAGHLRLNSAGSSSSSSSSPSLARRRRGEADPADPLQRDPISRQLKWRFLTSTAMSAAAASSPVQRSTRGRGGAAGSKRLRSAGAPLSRVPSGLEACGGGSHSPDVLQMSATSPEGTMTGTWGSRSSARPAGEEPAWNGCAAPHLPSSADSVLDAERTPHLLLLYPMAAAGAMEIHHDGERRASAGGGGGGAEMTCVHPSSAATPPPPPPKGIFYFGRGGGLHRSPPTPRTARPTADDGVSPPPSGGTGGGAPSPLPPHSAADTKAPLADPLAVVPSPPKRCDGVGSAGAAVAYPEQPSERIGPELHQQQPTPLTMYPSSPLDHHHHRSSSSMLSSGSDANFFDAPLEDANAAGLPMASSPPLASAPTVENLPSRSMWSSSCGGAAGDLQAALDCIPAAATHASLLPAYHVRPAIPHPQALPTHLLTAIDQAKRTMTADGNLQPRGVGPAARRQQLQLQQQHAAVGAPSASQSTTSSRRHQPQCPNTFALTLPRNQFKPSAQRHATRASTAGPPSVHAMLQRERDERLDRYIEQLREGLYAPQDDTNDPMRLPDPQSPTHVTRTLHKNSAQEKPSEAEAQLLWKESKVRPMPMLVGPSPMEHARPPPSCRALLKSAEVFSPPYAAAEAKRLAAQRGALTAMEYEEKTQPFRIATTLLTNTNARHLELVEMEERRKQRDQWLVRELGAFFPEDTEQEEAPQPLPPPHTITTLEGGANAEDPVAAAVQQQQQQQQPKPIPKLFPPAFKALLEDLQSPPIAASPSASTHRRHHHHHRRSEEAAGGGILTASPSHHAHTSSAGASMRSPRSHSARAGLSHRTQHFFGGSAFVGPSMVHHKHLDRLRAALVAPESELDELLQPPGWPHKRQSNNTPALCRSASSTAFEQYRKSMQRQGSSLGSTMISQENTSVELVNPEKRRLDEISALFLRLLEEAAETAQYGPADRDRIIAIHAAFQEQRLQQEYQNHHPLLDVAVSLAFDEQWAEEVRRHKSDKDRKAEEGQALAHAASKRIAAAAKQNALLAKEKAKALAEGGRRKKKGEKASSPDSAAAKRRKMAEAAEAAAKASIANPLFPLDGAWTREISRIQQHEGLLELLRHRPVEDLPGLLSAAALGISTSGSAAASVTSVDLPETAGSGAGSATGGEKAPVVSFPGGGMHASSAAAARRKSSSVASLGSPTEARRQSASGSGAAGGEEAMQDSPGPERAAAVEHRASRRVSVATPDSQQAAAAAGLHDVPVLPEQASGGASPEDRRCGSEEHLGGTPEGGVGAQRIAPPPPLRFLSPPHPFNLSTTAGAESSSFMNRPASTGGLLSSPSPMAATTPSDPWAMVREMGVAVPVGMNDPHMRLLLDHHESAVAEMALLMEAQEASVTNLLQQLQRGRDKREGREPFPPMQMVLGVLLLHRIKAKARERENRKQDRAEWRKSEDRCASMCRDGPPLAKLVHTQYRLCVCVYLSLYKRIKKEEEEEGNPVSLGALLLALLLFLFYLSISHPSLLVSSYNQYNARLYVPLLHVRKSKYFRALSPPSVNKEAVGGLVVLFLFFIILLFAAAAHLSTSPGSFGIIISIVVCLFVCLFVFANSKSAENRVREREKYKYSEETADRFERAHKETSVVEPQERLLIRLASLQPPAPNTRNRYIHLSYNYIYIYIYIHPRPPPPQPTEATLNTDSPVLQRGATKSRSESFGGAAGSATTTCVRAATASPLRAKRRLLLVATTTAAPPSSSTSRPSTCGTAPHTPPSPSCLRSAAHSFSRWRQPSQRYAAGAEKSTILLPQQVAWPTQAPATSAAPPQVAGSGRRGEGSGGGVYATLFPSLSQQRRPRHHSSGQRTESSSLQDSKGRSADGLGYTAAAPSSASAFSISNSPSASAAVPPLQSSRPATSAAPLHTTNVFRPYSLPLHSLTSARNEGLHLVPACQVNVSVEAATVPPGSMGSLARGPSRSSGSEDEVGHSVSAGGGSIAFESFSGGRRSTPSDTSRGSFTAPEGQERPAQQDQQQRGEGGSEDGRARRGGQEGQKRGDAPLLPIHAHQAEKPIQRQTLHLIRPSIPHPCPPATCSARGGGGAGGDEAGCAAAAATLCHSPVGFGSCSMPSIPSTGSLSDRFGYVEAVFACRCSAPHSPTPAASATTTAMPIQGGGEGEQVCHLLLATNSPTSTAAFESDGTTAPAHDSPYAGGTTKPLSLAAPVPTTAAFVQGRLAHRGSRSHQRLSGSSRTRRLPASLSNSPNAPFRTSLHSPTPAAQEPPPTASAASPTPHLYVLHRGMHSPAPPSSSVLNHSDDPYPSTSTAQQQQRRRRYPHRSPPSTPSSHPRRSSRHGTPAQAMQPQHPHHRIQPTRLRISKEKEQNAPAKQTAPPPSPPSSAAAGGAKSKCFPASPAVSDCPTAVGGHHLSLKCGRCFLKETGAAREERFYEAVRPFQERLVAMAAQMPPAALAAYSHVTGWVPSTSTTTTTTSHPAGEAGANLVSARSALPAEAFDFVVAGCEHWWKLHHHSTFHNYAAAFKMQRRHRHHHHPSHKHQHHQRRKKFQQRLATAAPPTTTSSIFNASATTLSSAITRCYSQASCCSSCCGCGGGAAHHLAGSVETSAAQSTTACPCPHSDSTPLQETEAIHPPSLLPLRWEAVSERVKGKSVEREGASLPLATTPSAAASVRRRASSSCPTCSCECCCSDGPPSSLPSPACGASTPPSLSLTATMAQQEPREGAAQEGRSTAHSTATHSHEQHSEAADDDEDEEEEEEAEPSAEEMYARDRDEALSLIASFVPLYRGKAAVATLPPSPATPAARSDATKYVILPPAEWTSIQAQQQQQQQQQQRAADVTETTAPAGEESHGGTPFPHVLPSGTTAASYREMIVLEDVCHGFEHPCVLDMKMGKRQYGLRASERKKTSKTLKANQSTSAEYGVRVAGYRRYDVSSKAYKSRSKIDCRYLTLDQVHEELCAFMDHQRGLELRFRQQVERLRSAFSQQRVFRFYTSSLLFVYDADQPAETARIVMIDFAFTYERRELQDEQDEDAPFEFDVGYLRALDTILSLLA
eukprot:gene268-142_t